MTTQHPIEVAIIGGGCAGIACAFELSRPELAGRFHVTVYQQGWRLGGKGASGRGPGARIEEHGLHLWMGYYENAFRLLRECYAELKPGAGERFQTWRDAFEPVSRVGVQETSGDGNWQSWLAAFPADDRLPGDPYDCTQAARPIDYLTRGLELARTLLASASGIESAAREPATNGRGGTLAGLLQLSADVLLTSAPFGEGLTLVAIAEALGALQRLLPQLPGLNGLDSSVGQSLDMLQQGLRDRINSLAVGDSAQRRTLEVAEVIMANMRGLVLFGLLTDKRGFDAIDEYDYRDWLRLCGASDRAINSAVIRGLYDLGFAYEDGDVSRPRFSAGQGLRSSMRAFFTYKGSLFWKMNAGMGDVVFAPLYKVLSARGVSFQFFHRLERVEMSQQPASAKDTPHVAALHFDVQAKVRGGHEYLPLVDIGDVDCWPSTPDYTQLVNGDDLRNDRLDFESHWDTRAVSRKTLRVARDFDFAVVAVGLGAIPYVCTDLVARDDRWRDMAQRVKTVPTQALQLWLTEHIGGLGWPHGSYDVSGFAEPFDTWADMTHLSAVERFPQRPGTVAYFCSVLPDDGPLPPRTQMTYLAAKNAEVARTAIRFIENDLKYLWPAAYQHNGHFRWELLSDPEDAAGTEDATPGRLRTQYWRANVNPTDRYTLSLPGTAAYRISPLDNTYDNLTVAGDWTDCGYNAGCVEAAFMSGRLAAHALSGSPPLEQITGFDHP